MKENKTETVDLIRDELFRIKAITTDSEIEGICNRGIKLIEQHVPVVVQRDKAIDSCRKLKHALSELNLRVNNGYDFNSDPDSMTLLVGEALRDELS